MTDDLEQETRVLYNAQCPVCNFEIKHYAQYSANMALPLGFDDLNSDALKTWNFTEDQAARRLYVLHHMDKEYYLYRIKMHLVVG